MSEEQRIYYENDFNTDISVNLPKPILSTPCATMSDFFRVTNLTGTAILPGMRILYSSIPERKKTDGNYGYQGTYSVENTVFGELIFDNIYGFSGNIGIRPSLLSISAQVSFRCNPVCR
jgi:hypothetical protein